MREANYSPPPPSYHSSAPVGHQSRPSSRLPTYFEDQQHLLSQQGQSQRDDANEPTARLPLLRLRNTGYQATFWKWVASVVVLGVSASTVSEDELQGTWLIVMAYNIACVRCPL
jgi:hypothetical protein